MGRPKSLKHNGPEGQSGRRSEGLPKRTSARSSTSSAHLSNWSTRALASDTSRLRAVSPIGRPGPKRCFLLRPRVSDRGPRRKPSYRSFPTGAAKADWGHPTRDACSEGTKGEQRRQCTSQTTIPGTIPCTPTRTVLHNRLDTYTIIGADICIYNIVGVVGLPYDKKPPTCLWASMAL